ncbi:MAG: tetratricopeptide repeat protein [Anaerolineales bacterium]
MAGKTTKEKILQDAVEAGQKGHNARARKLLLKLLRTDNQEPLYWLLMSTAVESREERIYCLQNVLFLDPDSSAAKHDLELLGAEIPQMDVPAFVPEETGDWQTKEIAAPKIPKKRRKRKEEPWSINWILASLGLGIVVIILGYYAAENGLLSVLFEVTPSPTFSQSGTLPAAATATRTQLSAGTATGQATVIARSPEDMLDATYTPTPQYINTPHADNEAFNQGMAALGAEDWGNAIALFETYLASNPNAPDAAYYLGTAHLGAQDLLAAQAAFNRAITLDAEFAPGYLGRAQVGIAQAEAATNIITDLNTAILLDANFVDAYLERASFNLGRGNLADAGADVARAEAIAPLSALVQYHKALIALAQEQFSVALQASQLALSLDLTLLPNYLAKAKAEQGLLLYADSIASMQRYLSFTETSLDARGWEILGLGFYFSDQRQAALDTFEHAVSLDPNLAEASYYLGIQAIEEGNLQAALGYFRVAVTGAPGWFEAHARLAEALLATGNPSMAFLEINTSSNLLETNEQRAMFFYWRALALEALGLSEDALADWRSLLALPADAMPSEWRQAAEERVG